MASSLRFSAKHKHANSPACMRSLMETMNSLVFGRQSSCAQLSQLVHFYVRKKSTDPDFSLDADWRSYQSFSNHSHRAKYWMETGVVDEQTVFAVDSTNWKLKCRNSTDLWRPTVPWWLRSLSALPSPTLLCISALQPGTHSLAGTDKVTITWTSLVFHRKSTTGVVFVSVFL